MHTCTLYYVANARMPNEKAHGIQIAKMCEAFLEAGIDLVLVLPKRGSAATSIKEFYGLRTEVPVIELPAFNWYNGGRVLYHFSTFSFMCSYLLYFLLHVDRKKSVIYTVDLDHLSYGFLPLLGIPYFSEMHGGKPKTLLHRFFFSHIVGVIPTTTIAKEQLQQTYGLTAQQLIVEPNGVDLLHFSPQDKEAVRQQLGIPEHTHLALYVGRFFTWKGLEIIDSAAKKLATGETLGIAGGSKESFEYIAGKTSSRNLVFYGEKPYAEIPLWLGAADCLLVLGTARDEQSYRYTSPMKVFEYMASRTPIVASKTPALCDILTDAECFFYEPDQPEDLARAVEDALGDPSRAKERAEAAYVKVSTHTWSERVHRVREFLNNHLESMHKEI